MKEVKGKHLIRINHVESINKAIEVCKEILSDDA